MVHPSPGPKWESSMSVRRPPLPSTLARLRPAATSEAPEVMRSSSPVATSPNGQRLPSTRPIDHRWDGSRGIVFSTTSRSEKLDFRWKPQDAIIFADAPIRRGRTYATRALPGSRQSSVSSRTSDVSDPHGFSVRASASAHVQLLQAKHAAVLKQASEAQIELAQDAVKIRKQYEELNAAHLRTIGQLKKAEQMLKEQLATERKEEQQKISEMERKSEAKQREYELALEKLRLTSQAELNATVDGLKQQYQTPYEKMLENAEAKAREELRLETDVLAEKKNEVEATLSNLKMIVERHKAENAIETDLLQAQRKLWHEQIAQQDAAKERSSQLLSIQSREDVTAQLQRAAERATYRSFRSLWDLSDPIGAISSSIHRLAMSLKAHEKAWHTTVNAKQPVLSRFKGSSRLITLNKEIDEFPVREAENIKYQVEDLLASVDNLNQLYTSIFEIAHVSRELSRPLRLSSFVAASESTKNVMQTLYSSPALLMNEPMSRPPTSLESRLDEKQIESMSGYFDSLGYTRRQTAMLAKDFSTLVFRMKIIQVIKARLLDPPVEKEAYVLQRNAISRLREAKIQWYRYADLYDTTNSKLNAALIEREKNCKEAYLSGLKKFSFDVDEHTLLVRKRRYLQSVLGETVDDAKNDKVINDKITEAEKSFLSLLDYSFLARGGKFKVSQEPSWREPSAEWPLSGDHSVDGQETSKSVDSVTEMEALDVELRSKRSTRRARLRRAARAVISISDRPRGNANMITSSLSASRKSSSVKSTIGNAIQPSGSVTTDMLHGSVSTPALSTRQLHTRPCSSMPQSRDKVYSHESELNSNTEAFIFAGRAVVSAPTLLTEVKSSGIAESGSSSSRRNTRGGASSRPTTMAVLRDDSYSPDITSQSSAIFSECDVSACSDNSIQLSADTCEQKSPTAPVHYQATSTYRISVAAFSSNQETYWSYKHYTNSDGKPPLVYYCINLDQAETRVQEFLNEAIIGFDLEWTPYATLGKHSIKSNVSLIQLACEDKIALLHVAVFKGDNPQDLMPPSLRKILESNRIAKVGVNIRGDANRIRGCFDIEMQGTFELSHLYRVVEYGHRRRELVNFRLVNLAQQVQDILHMPLNKGEVRLSQWSRRLDLQQCEYAASDAYAGFQLYHALEAKRLNMDSPPPRPSFYETRDPLILGDGSKIYHTTQSSKRVYPARIQPLPNLVEDEDAPVSTIVPLLGIHNILGNAGAVEASRAANE